MSKNSIVFWFVFVKNKNNESNFKDIVKGISRWRKNKRRVKKTGWEVVFRFTANLKSILSNGKSKLLSNRYPGMR